MWWRRAFSPRSGSQKPFTSSHKTLACNPTLPIGIPNPERILLSAFAELSAFGNCTFQLRLIKHGLGTSCEYACRRSGATAQA